MLAGEAISPDCLSREPLGSRLIALAEEFFDIPVGSVCHKKRRNGNITKARWAVAHVLLENVGWSQPRIGRLMNKDQTSIWNGYEKSKKLIRVDPLFYEAVQVLVKEILPHDRNPDI